MTKSSIEITDSAYLITLDKSEFEYPLVRKLLNKLLSDGLYGQDQYVSEEDNLAVYAPALGKRFDFLADK